MSNSNLAKQAISVLSLPVKVQQDTPKGTWVSADGVIATTTAPFGVTQYDAKKGDMVSVTVLGTASMNMAGIATANVKKGDLVLFDAAITVAGADTYATNASKVIGIALYDANVNAHAEIFIR